MPEPSFYQELLDNLNDGIYFTDTERKITYFNTAAERITGYGRTEVIGTRCSDNILVHVNEKGENLCQSACPLAKCICQGDKKEERVYLHHKNGHRVPVLVRVIRIKNAQGNAIGGAEIFSDLSPKTELMERIEELQKQALIDPLTLVGNRRYADLDHLKTINDKYGHEIGDAFLKMVAKTMLNSVRASDLVCRWGGDEFIAITGPITPDMLYAMSERLRLLVSQSFISVKNNIVQSTVSVGATLAQPEDTESAIFSRADRLLYQSKQAGRNYTSTDAVLNNNRPA